VSGARFLARLCRRSVITAGLFVLAGAGISGNALLLQPERRPAPIIVTRTPAEAPSASVPLVRAVQEELSRSGLYDGPLDGLAGPRTRSAIRAFEARSGRALTGAASERLLAALREARRQASAEAPAPEPPAPQPAFDERIAAVQSALARAAYGPLGADGRYGPKTREAIARFQSDHGLPVTGDISDALVVELRAVGALEDL
jgi:peptidoglycan hydrolase-like protein with peptidoglycan-binding domain